MNTDWRVQLGQHAIDGLIAVGVLVLMALRPDFVSIGVALLGPLVGARAAALKGSSSSAVPAPVGGAVALVVAGGAMLAAMGLRARGVAVMALLALGTVLATGACTATQRAQVLTIGANDCVLISDPVGRAMCVTADELLLLINQLTASSSSSSSPVVYASATVAGSATAPAAPPTQIRTPVTSIRLVAPLASSSSSSSR